MTLEINDDLVNLLRDRIVYITKDNMNYWEKIGATIDAPIMGPLQALLIMGVGIRELKHHYIDKPIANPYAHEHLSSIDLTMISAFITILCGMRLSFDPMLGKIAGIMAGVYTAPPVIAFELFDDFLQYNKIIDYDITDYIRHELLGNDLTQVD